VNAAAPRGPDGGVSAAAGMPVHGLRAAAGTPPVFLKAPSARMPRRARGRRLPDPAALFLAAVAAAAIAAPALTRYGPTEMSKQAVLALPSWAHLLGTDEFGRDLLSRLLYGGRIALVIGAGATGVAALCGVPLGLWSGFKGGALDSVAMRAVDTLLAIPPVLLAMALVAAVGPGSLNAGIAVAVVGLPQFARIARAGVLAHRGMDYVEASVAAGAGDARIVFRSILPNVLSPVLVQIPIGVSRAILLEASLSFLGLGTQPPQPSWGSMISESREYMYAAPWYGIVPGTLIALTVLALNHAADRVRARWRTDPRM
jgi:ABC-type dipeptide/oligopeptide/nickel transport system permease subunit